ncbi:MAG: radical SAM family heme chaperone HemW [Sporichthyaceae bacterium]
MAAVPPAGEPVPADGGLPAPALTDLAQRAFGVYLHVPFCASRCGYCDFNTYTAAELGDGASRSDYPASAIAEIRLAARVLALGGAELPRAQTVFLGGGTPTLLSPAALGSMLSAVRAEFGLCPDAEITTEANPDSVDEASLVALRTAGFTRISFGMQSARPHVLAALERTHTPGRAAQAVSWARAAGFDHVNLDLIYGAPGESDQDWALSLSAALAAGPDHVSAYALIVEEGTRLAARVRRGEVSVADDDTLARRYELTDATLTAAGLPWYEVSNWAAPGAACRHNQLYWTGANWWGIGPGAHSHIGGVRWWNVRHPRDYAARLSQGHSPGAGREVLGAAQRRLEEVMLRLRLADGLALSELGPAGSLGAERAARDGLLDRVAYGAGRAVLTLRGRLLADAVVRDLTE